MRAIPKEQVVRRIQSENIWWGPEAGIGEAYRGLRRRGYFDLFFPLVLESKIRRAVLLMGPRRVGKTVLLHHAIQKLIEDGVAPRRICYISVDHPLYNDCGLDELLALFSEASGADPASGSSFVFFDEIQYLKEWEKHLKSLVDDHPNVKFVASGSAAAALKLKSAESGAGRFTDFLLPPLTFHEYLDLLGKGDLVMSGGTSRFWQARDINLLNRSFLHYLNFGGYPEVIFSDRIQADPARYVKSDIIDKVLLRDLPSLYGIQDIQELNYLFTTLAFNTADEVSLEHLSQNSGVAKNTIKRYIEYLEAAFLIKVVHRIDRSARRFQRANYFKVYLTNPSMRGALFSPIGEEDEAMGRLAETGVYAQWFHASAGMEPRLYYARWPRGEIDIVSLENGKKPDWAVEVKWSDRIADRPEEWKILLDFCRRNSLEKVVITTRTVLAEKNLGGIRVEFVPASLYCYTVGHNLIRGRRGIAGRNEESEPS